MGAAKRMLEEIESNRLAVIAEFRDREFAKECAVHTDEFHEHEMADDEAFEEIAEAVGVDADFVHRAYNELPSECPICATNRDRD